MNDIYIISPIKNARDVGYFAKNTDCRVFYVYYHKFLNNFEDILEYINEAKKYNSQIFVNFKHSINEVELEKIVNFIKYLKSTKIDGIFINCYAILEAIKNEELPFKVIIDSYFDIHNIAGIEFIKSFQKIDGLILTEEIYVKNVEKIKQFTKIPLAVDTDNLPWCIDDIKQNKSINATVIKGDFETSEDILDAIKYIQNVINFPETYKNKKLPFKHVRKGLYKTNHFSGEILSTQGQDFEFSKNIEPFERVCRQTRLKKNFDYKSLVLPDLCLRLSSLEQIKRLKKYIDKLGFNPVHSVEYGEIVSTSDLSKKSFEQVIDYVKKFCFEYDIQLAVSTPKILIERDFDRVFEYVKNMCLTPPCPHSIVINNIGYFEKVIKDKKLKNFPIEIGYGINLLNSMSVRCLNNFHKIYAVDLSVIKDKQKIASTLKNLNNLIPRRKLNIAGNIKIPTLGLCPLNSNSAIVSRLSCKAPCTQGNFAIKDPILEKTYPFVVDGFCRMHMYKDKILNIFSLTDEFASLGINEFVIDLNGLNSKFIPILLTQFLNCRAGFESFPACDFGEYNVT